LETKFAPEQLKNPSIARSNEILRTCVHCGFCTATCPTYQVLGDELDSPRGRIYLIKDMLENNRPADEKTVMHLDRCLSCLACMTTCPSDVHYMHLIDHAREYIEQTYQRPWLEKLIRTFIAVILTNPTLFRLGMLFGKIAKPFAGVVPEKRLQAMIKLIPSQFPSAPIGSNIFPAVGETKYRVALFMGCVQQAINPKINSATISLLTQLGCEVIVQRERCCGALTHHMGKANITHKTALQNIEALDSAIQNNNLDAIIINTSGCGTTIKDYGHIFRLGPHQKKAARVAQLSVDITEFLDKIDYPQLPKKGVRVGYHAACSLQHGQAIKHTPIELLERAGYDVITPRNSHLCCGSAGTYNMLQPEISAELAERKINSLEAINPDIIATGNIGCMLQIGRGTETPVLHTVQILDEALRQNHSEA